MATTLQEYISMSDPSYAARRQGIQNQINDINPHKQAALDSAQGQYNTSLNRLNQQKADYALDAQESAASRGLAWSNIADNYKSNYEKNNYTPAVTSLNDALNNQNNSINESYTNRQRSLEDALNSLTNEQYQYAQSLWQKDKDRAAQLQAQRDAAAIQSKSLASYYGGQKAVSSVGRVQRGTNKGTDMNGFYFYDANGNPITANAYVSLNPSSISLNALLNDMASAGDNNAQAVLSGSATNHQRSMLGLPAINNYIKSGGYAP